MTAQLIDKVEYWRIYAVCFQMQTVQMFVVCGLMLVGQLSTCNACCVYFRQLNGVSADQKLPVCMHHCAVLRPDGSSCPMWNLPRSC